MDVFNRGKIDAPSGPALMFASALKALGLQPEVISELSTKLLQDMRQVSGLQPEILARLEFLLKCTPAREGSPSPDAWVEYLEWRQSEYGRPNGSGITSVGKSGQRHPDSGDSYGSGSDGAGG